MDHNHGKHFVLVIIRGVLQGAVNPPCDPLIKHMTLLSIKGRPHTPRTAPYEKLLIRTPKTQAPKIQDPTIQAPKLPGRYAREEVYVESTDRRQVQGHLQDVQEELQDLLEGGSDGF